MLHTPHHTTRSITPWFAVLLAALLVSSLACTTEENNETNNTTNNTTGGGNNTTGGTNNTTGGTNNTTGGTNNTTGGTNNTTGGTNNSTGGMNNSTGGTNNNTGGTNNTPGPQWAQVASPCPGDVIALWFDTATDGMAGCGTNGAGEGLFVTEDGGLSWKGERDFEQVRVNDIRRDASGALYAAGWSTLDGWSACAIDESGARLVPTGLFAPGNNAFTKVAQGENIAITAGGRIFVDNLTGTQFAYRLESGGEFVEVRSMTEETLTNEDAPGVQLKKVMAVGEGYWATEARIINPATLYLPSTREGATYQAQAVVLQASNRQGDLNDLHVWDTSNALAVGYDQGTQYPLIYRLADGNPYDAGAWEAIDVADFGIEYKGGINAMSVRGDVVIVVGEKVPSSAGGFILRSADRGKTWEDITPLIDNKKLATLSRVWQFEDGGIFAGGDGKSYRYSP